MWKTDSLLLTEMTLNLNFLYNNNIPNNNKDSSQCKGLMSMRTLWYTRRILNNRALMGTEILLEPHKINIFSRISNIQPHQRMNLQGSQFEATLNHLFWVEMLFNCRLHLHNTPQSQTLWRIMGIIIAGRPWIILHLRLSHLLRSMLS